MLVERGDHLAELLSVWESARSGDGALVLVAGEAGLGKSTLVRALAAELAGTGRVRQGGADHVTTPDALAALHEAVPEIAPLVAAARETGAHDRHALHTAIRAALGAESTLLILEDLHWADDATLDAVRHLGRRLDGLPVMIVATYRPDDIGAAHPLIALLGDAPRWPRTSRIEVPPLTRDGIATLVAHAGVDADADVLLARTGGNAFFVTELLAAGSVGVPSSVADAVLARYARLPPEAQDAAAAAAVLGSTASASLVAAVAGRDLAAVDTCVDHGMLVRPTEGDVGFRHELARQSIEQGLTALRARQLHRRAQREVARRSPEDHRRIAHHAAAAGDSPAAARHAAIAGGQLASLGAHREAVLQYRAALHHGAAGDDRAALFVALSYECYLTDQLQEAITARHHALELHEVAGARAEVGDDLRWLSRLSWFLGRGADAERFAHAAIGTLEPDGASARLAMALSNLAQLRMLAMSTDEAVSVGQRALAMAARLGEDEIQAHALNNIGAAQMMAGALDAGAARLRQSLDLSIARGFEEHAARAYTNLGSIAAYRRVLDQGMHDLEAGIAYTEAHDLDSWNRYMLAVRSAAQVDLGDLDGALATALEVLGSPGLSPISVIPAACSAARVTALRGGDAGPHLDRAWELASETAEIQRIGPAASAAAEDAWLRGATEEIEERTRAAWELARDGRDPWVLGELAWWRHLAGLEVHADGAMAPPFGPMLAGRTDEATHAWKEIGSPLWAAYAGVLADDAASAGAALRVLEQREAPAAVDAALRTRRARGLALPRRPRGAARQRPGHLTDREHEVLTLLARGLSTADIAEALVVSPRTVEHHVSAVLRKVGEPTRARAVATARDEGLLDDE